jgi:hypothetical protein
MTSLIESKNQRLKAPGRVIKWRVTTTRVPQLAIRAARMHGQ